jgi:2-dehydro-3-deoxygluconokinase
MTSEGGTILALGECMVELAPRGPEDGGGYALGFAGDTFNIAWYLRRMLPPGWRVAYGSAVGTDTVSDRMVAFMAEAGIDTGWMRRLPDRTVGLYLIDLQDGERSFSYWRGQSAARTLADDPDWLARVLARADIVVFSGITMAILAPEARDRLCLALAEARRAGKQIAFDTNMRPRLWADRAEMQAGLLQAASVASIVLPSFDEEAACFGDATPQDTIARYRDAGAETVIVKNGAGPVEVWSAATGTDRLAPAPVARVVDSTAAGDSFAAGVVSVLATGGALTDAVRTGMALAGMVVQGQGALVPVDPAALPGRTAAGHRP